MCKINGHNMFTWLLQPAWNWKKLQKTSDVALTKKANQEKAIADKQIEELNKPETNDIEGEMPTPVAPVTPVNTKGTGINNTAQKRIGLNL